MDKVYPRLIFPLGIELNWIVEPDALDRELQSKELARIMSASYPRPVVFLGYVVTTPKALRRKRHLFCTITKISLIEYSRSLPNLS